MKIESLFYDVNIKKNSPRHYSTDFYDNFEKEEKIRITREKSLKLLDKVVSCSFPKLPSNNDKIVLQGSLKELTLIDLFQLLSMTVKTAKLLVSQDEKVACITFEKGNLVDALLDNLRGIEAVEEILEWEYGEFIVRSATGHFDYTINQKTEYLILDILRRKDERENLNS